MTESEAISYELRGNIALIAIDRPSKRNAMNQAMFEALGKAAQRAQGYLEQQFAKALNDSGHMRLLE